MDVDNASETPFDVVIGEGDEAGEVAEVEVEDGDVGVTTAFSFLSSIAGAVVAVAAADAVLESGCEIEAEDVVGERVGVEEAEAGEESEVEVEVFELGLGLGLVVGDKFDDEVAGERVEE